MKQSQIGIWKRYRKFNPILDAASVALKSNKDFIRRRVII